MNKINTYNESTLHAQLKKWYQQPGDELEKQVNGFIIDIKRAGQLIEIQTSNFAAIKRKLLKLLPLYKIRVVYPIPQLKWILKYDETNLLKSKRRSPKTGKPLDIFTELIRWPELVTHPNFSLEILMIEMEEIRIDNGKGSWRRKGVSISDRKLVNVIESIILDKALQVLDFLPREIIEPFSVRQLAEALNVSNKISGRIVYSLRKMGVIVQVGKRRNALLYKKLRTDFRPGDYYEQVLNRLPEKPLFIGKENYFHSVVFVPFVEIAEVQFLLFQKRSDKIRQPGEICFPGGGVDPFKDRTKEDTAIRETIEELGVSRKQIEVGKELGVMISPLGAFVEVILGKLAINNISQVNPDSKEVEKVFLVPVDYFRNNLPQEYDLKYEIHSVVKGKDGEELELFPAQKLGIPPKYWYSWSGKQHRIYVYKFENEVIWGITAEIVRALVNRIDLQ